MALSSRAHKGARARFSAKMPLKLVTVTRASATDQWSVSHALFPEKERRVGANVSLRYNGYNAKNRETAVSLRVQPVCE